MITEENLTNRRLRGAEEVDEAIQTMRGRRKVDTAEPTPITEAQALAVLQGRLAAAREIKDPTPHCGDCWRRGRDSAIRLIEG